MTSERELLATEQQSYEACCANVRHCPCVHSCMSSCHDAAHSSCLQIEGRSTDLCCICCALQQQHIPVPIGSSTCRGPSHGHWQSWPACPLGVSLSLTLHNSVQRRRHRQRVTEKQLGGHVQAHTIHAFLSSAGTQGTCTCSITASSMAFRLRRALGMHAYFAFQDTQSKISSPLRRADPPGHVSRHGKTVTSQHFELNML